jgi:hypothetical protein
LKKNILDQENLLLRIARNRRSPASG